MKQYADDPSPGELWPELALQRALLADYLDRFPDGVPLRGEDTERMFGLLESIGKQTERIHRIMAQTALTVAEVNYLQAVLADLLKRYISEDKRAAFLAELKSVTNGKVGGDDGVRIIVRYEEPRKVKGYVTFSPDDWEDDFAKMSDEQLRAIVNS